MDRRITMQEPAGIPEFVCTTCLAAIARNPDMQNHFKETVILSLSLPPLPLSRFLSYIT